MTLFNRDTQQIVLAPDGAIVAGIEVIVKGSFTTLIVVFESHPLKMGKSW